jgi:hypothetical protein
MHRGTGHFLWDVRFTGLMGSGGEGGGPNWPPLPPTGPIFFLFGRGERRIFILQVISRVANERLAQWLMYLIINIEVGGSSPDTIMYF